MLGCPLQLQRIAVGVREHGTRGRAPAGGEPCRRTGRYDRRPGSILPNIPHRHVLARVAAEGGAAVASLLRLDGTRTAFDGCDEEWAVPARERATAVAARLAGLPWPGVVPTRFEVWGRT